MSEDKKTAAEEFKIYSTGTTSYNETDYVKPGETRMRFWSDSDLTFTGGPTMTISANVELSAMTFRAIEGKEVLKIDNEGRLIPGKDMSMDEVTQGVFAALQSTLPKYAEIARLREVVEIAASWLERWGVHVGQCEGGDRCTCGLTRIRYDISAALNPKE